MSQYQRSSFSERFTSRPASSQDGIHESSGRHPAALQSGSVVHGLHQPQYNQGWGNNSGPPSYHLNEERVRSLPAEPGILVRSRTGSGEETQTLGPHDSVSNAGQNEWSRRDLYAQQGNHPSRFSQVNSFSDPRRSRQRADDERHSAYNPRESVSQLPLMNDNAGYVGHEKGAYSEDDVSTMDEDTEPGQRSRENKYDANAKSPFEDPESGAGSSYPPLPYQSIPDEKDQSEDTKQLRSRTSNKRPKVKRPNVWLRQIRDTTPLEEKIRLHKKGVGVQDRPWACYVLTLICCIVFIVELVKSVSRARFP